MDQESIFDRKDDQIIQNIKDAWDKEIQNKLQQIVVSAFSHERLYVSERAQFIKLIALSLKEKDKNYIFGLITEIKKSDKLRKHLFSVIPVFSLLLEKSSGRKVCS